MATKNSLILGFSFLLSIFGATAKQGNKSVQGNFNNPSKLSIIYNINLKGNGSKQMISTSDGGSLVNSNLDSIRYVITKLSSDGIVEWERIIGVDTPITIRNIVEIPNVGYEVTGYIFLGNNAILYPNCRYVVRLNLKGEITANWPIRKGSKNAKVYGVNPIIRCSNGTYVTISDFINQTKILIPYFWRYDTDGNLINEVILDTMWWATLYINTMFETVDGGFGVLLSGRDTDDVSGKMQFWKLDNTGKKLWSKEIDSWNSIDYATFCSAIETKDGGFAVVALNSTPERDTAHTILRKFDLNGNLLFRNKFALKLWNAPTQIIETPLGNLLVGGFTQNNDTWHFVPKSSDYFLFKTSSTGELKWMDSFGDNESGDKVLDIYAIDDHTIVISGFTGLIDNSYAGTKNLKSTVIKISDLASAVAEQPAEYDGIHLFPNPTSTQFTLSGVEGVVSVRVVNSLGEEVKQFTHVSSQYSIDVSDLVSGLYFVSIRTAKGAVVKPMMVSR